MLTNGGREMKHVSKINKVLNLLLKGHTISQQEAIAFFSYYRLSDGIYRLKKRGYDIKTTMIYLPNNERYARYELRRRF